ncbi:mitochondrial inner membrane protein OXA1 [Humulus lupulus]|uniref:mitochondrial inner membrane protein OXA1 n=1 Tax=Humulus lupulus TaxID=3486 RepID=UPI002B401847|nr:mitochondrial inner membrane protein OXA1 [Humulus lupulus]XP_062074558.1 mitochondrial inner membrane protein OXA1 [Humulus lupulus]
MAYRRSLSTRATIVARQCHPSVFHLLRDDDHKSRPVNGDFSTHDSNTFLQKRFFGNGISKIGSGGFGGFAQDRRFSKALISSSSGFAFHRYMSTNVDEGSVNFGIVNDVAEVLSDAAVQVAASQAPAVDEVAIAAADSYLPVQLLQYLIDAVHTYGGLNWWAAIAVTTLMIRGATIPLLINQLKATSKLSIMRPHLEDVKQQMQEGNISTIEGQKRMQKIFHEYGVSPFTPLKGLFIQGPVFISFFLAINNMAEKVPSFKGGGAFWFVDLTIPDALYVLPVLTGLSFLITVECNMQEGLEGNPIAGTMKNVSRGLAIVTVPFTASFPQAIFCYWITSNVFSLFYGLALKRPGVKKFLGIPEVPVEASTAQQSTPPTFASLFSSMKQSAAVSATKQSAAVTQEQISTPAESSRLTDRRISSTSVISQRLKSLEKQVKGRKKNKKR